MFHTLFFPCVDLETQTDQTFPAIWNARKDSVECFEFQSDCAAFREVFLIEQTSVTFKSFGPSYAVAVVGDGVPSVFLNAYQTYP